MEQLKQFFAGILAVSIGIYIGYEFRPNAHDVVRDEYRRDFFDATEIITGVGLISEKDLKNRTPDIRVLTIEGYKDYDALCFRYPKSDIGHTDCLYFEDITEH